MGKNPQGNFCIEILINVEYKNYFSRCQAFSLDSCSWQVLPQSAGYGARTMSICHHHRFEWSHALELKIRNAFTIRSRRAALEIVSGDEFATAGSNQQNANVRVIIMTKAPKRYHQSRHYHSSAQMPAIIRSPGASAPSIQHQSYNDLANIFAFRLYTKHCHTAPPGAGCHKNRGGNNLAGGDINKRPKHTGRASTDHRAAGLQVFATWRPAESQYRQALSTRRCSLNLVRGRRWLQNCGTVTGTTEHRVKYMSPISVRSISDLLLVGHVIICRRRPLRTHIKLIAVFAAKHPPSDDDAFMDDTAHGAVSFGSDAGYFHTFGLLLLSAKLALPLQQQTLHNSLTA